MEQGHGPPASANIPYLSLNARDAAAREPAAHADAAERHNEARVDGFNLTVQPMAAGLDLLGQRIPVPGGAALDHIGDEHLGSGYPGFGQHFGQELAAPADKRPALFVLDGPGAFADEHD